MNTNNPYGKALGAYQQTRDENLSQMEIVLELYKGMIRFLREAKAAHAKGDFETMMHWVDRFLKVVEALHVNVDDEAGGEDAQFLAEFYTVLTGRIGLVLDRPDPQHEFQQLIDYIQPVYERWYELVHGRKPFADADETDGSIKAD